MKKGLIQLFHFSAVSENSILGITEPDSSLLKISFFSDSGALWNDAMLSNILVDGSDDQ